MGLANYTYRLKPQSGDSTPHDELASAGDLTGGTISLVDLGGGDYAWQFAGAATAAGPSKTVTGGTTGTGITVAIRVAITSYDSSDYAFLSSYATDSTPTNGLIFGQAGANVVRLRWRDGADSDTTVGTVGTSIRTYVIKVVTSATSAQDWVYGWADGVTGSGDTPDYDNDFGGQNFSSFTLDTINVGSSNSTIRIADLVIWGEELSDADCHALAENGIREVLDAPIVKSVIASGYNANIFTASAYTTPAMTVPDNCLLVVCVYIMEYNGVGNRSGSITCAKNGGGATFTPQVNAGDTTSWTIGVRAFTCPVTTGGSWQLDLDCSTYNVWYGYSVYAFTGYDTDTPVGATAFDNAGGTDGAFNALVLSSTPAASSYVVSIIGTDGPNAGTGPLEGSGWTRDYRYSVAGQYAFAVESKTGHTSTSVPWDDVAEGGTSCGHSVAVALEIKAGPEAPAGEGPYEPILITEPLPGALGVYRSLRGRVG